MEALQASATKNYCAPISREYPATIRTDRMLYRLPITEEIAGSSPVALATAKNRLSSMTALQPQILRGGMLGTRRGAGALVNAYTTFGFSQELNSRQKSRNHWSRHI
jgi:hypothetical protein